MLRQVRGAYIHWIYPNSARINAPDAWSAKANARSISQSATCWKKLTWFSPRASLTKKSSHKVAYMFVFLSKFLPPLIYPLGLAILLLAAALILRKNNRLRTAAIVFSFLILLIASNRWVAYSLARSLEWRYLPQGDIPAADAIVLLGGGTDPAISPRKMVEINGAGDRILYAARLYKDGKAPVILASGGNVTLFGERPSTPASEMAEILEFMGIPHQAIWLQPDSQNTYEDALYSARMLKAKGINRVILVTSALHMPRSVALFEKQGIQVIPAPADFTITVDNWQQLRENNLAGQIIDLLPNTSNLGLTNNALKEYLGWLAYRLRGWL